jgi:hypothetical protein
VGGSQGALTLGGTKGTKNRRERTGTWKLKSRRQQSRQRRGGRRYLWILEKGDNAGRCLIERAINLRGQTPVRRLHHINQVTIFLTRCGEQNFKRVFCNRFYLSSGPPYIWEKRSGHVPDFQYERIYVAQGSIKQASSGISGFAEPQRDTGPGIGNPNSRNRQVVLAPQSGKTTIESLVSASFSATVWVPVIYAKVSGFVQEMDVQHTVPKTDA